ncbi:MAG TPA: hypothetical protein PKH07_05525 [bacterium]|nr:hypothetical protein [bacterium]
MAEVRWTLQGADDLDAIAFSTCASLAASKMASEKPERLCGTVTA